jgi:hypothetical protein
MNGQVFLRIEIIDTNGINDAIEEFSLETITAHGKHMHIASIVKGALLTGHRVVLSLKLYN